MRGLGGKAAFVTGAASGIGRASGGGAGAGDGQDLAALIREK